MFQGIFKSAVKMPDTNTNYIFGTGSIPIQIKTAQLATFADGTTKQQGYQVAEVNKLISTMLTGWSSNGNKPKSMSDNYLELILSCGNGVVVKKRLQFPHIIAWQNDNTPYNIADIYKQFSIDNWLKADDFENPDITLVVEPTDEILTTSTANPPEVTTTNSGRFYLYYRNLPIGVNRIHIDFHIKTKTEPIDFDLEVVDGLSWKDAQVILASNAQAKLNILLSTAKDVYNFTGAEGDFGEITMHEWSALYQQLINLKPNNKFTHDLCFYLYDESEFNTKVKKTIPQIWVEGMKLDKPVVGETPNFVSDSTYLYCYIEGLKKGDVVNAYFRAGWGNGYGAKLKNGVIVETIIQNQETLERTYIVDDTFDAIILNNYIYYVSSPTAEVIALVDVSRISLIESNIDDLQKTVNDIIEQGVGGEFNLLCFGNSFTQDTISYIPWLIKECEPNLKLNVYFTYMGGMPISQCLAYISNGTTIALNASGTPTTKYENHGGWDRIYSYSNGEWVEPDPSETNYHKSYVLYKYEDGANGWVSQSEPTAASVLQMKNWDLITIQQGGSINFGSWDYYFKPYIYKIQAELQEQVKHNFKLGYLMTHASYATTSETLLEHYNGIIQNSTKMLENTPIEIIMPYATALQNARTTYLDRFGAGGHLMGDTAHVSDGIGCLVCAYANTMTILDLIGSRKSIVGSQIYPDAAWLSLHNIPAVSSTIEGLSTYNIWLAQQCAVMATKYPLQLTDMVAKGMCGNTEVEMVLSNCISSNFICSINIGESYKTTLIADDGFVIKSVTVTMNGIDITSSAYNQTTNEINIENVNGKIKIIADAI